MARAERVIVSQIVRSPGGYLKKELKAGKYLYFADLLPGRGTWLQFESDTKDVLSVRIDRQRKLNATMFIRALGIESDEDILALFGDNQPLRNTLEKDEEGIKSSQGSLAEIFRKMKPGEPLTSEGIVNYLVQKFFDGKRYDLGRAGRFKYIRKLGIYNRLPGTILAENLVSADGDIRFKKGHLLTQDDVEALRNEEFFEQGAHTLNLNVNTKLDEHGTVNLVKVYNNDKKEKVCHIVGTDLNSFCNHVTIPDMLAIFSYFLNIP